MIGPHLPRSLTIVALVVLGAGSAIAQVRSGLPVGEFTQSIPVSDVTGPYKGERICYVCDFEADPNVLAFLRDTSGDAAKLIAQLNELYVKNKDRKFKAVVMIVAGESSKKWLEELNRSQRFEIPLTFFTKGPKDAAARVYNLNPEVQNTFLVTVNRTVAANISDIAAGQFDQVVRATEEMLAGTSKK